MTNKLDGLMDMIVRKKDEIMADIAEGGNGSYSFPLSPEEGLTELDSKVKCLDWTAASIAFLSDPKRVIEGEFVRLCQAEAPGMRDRMLDRVRVRAARETLQWVLEMWPA